MADNTFLGSFVTQYAQLILPLKEAIQSESSFRALFLDLGWSIPNPPVTQAQTVVNRINILTSSLDDLSESPSEIDMIMLLADINQVFVSVKNFANAIASTTSGIAPAQQVFKNEFPSDLFNYLICKYLQAYYKKGFNVFKATDIIKYSFITANNPRPSYSKIKIDFPRFITLITQPQKLIESTIDWNTQKYNFDNVAFILFNFLSSLRIPATLNSSFDLEKSALYNNTFENEYALGSSVKTYLLNMLIGNEYKTLITNFSSYEGTTVNTKGMILEVDIPEGTNLKQNINDNISLELNNNQLVGSNFALQFNPSQQKFSYLNKAGDNSRIEVLFKNIFDSPKRIFGQPEGTRLDLRNQALSLSVTPGTPFEFGLGYDLSGLALVIDPSDSDNFIKKIFGDKKKEIVFPLTIQWSSKNGISFVGSGSFEFNVNTHFKIGPIEFTDIKVALRAPQGQDKVVTNIGTNVKGDLGPVVFTIDDIGLRITLNLKEDNAGPFGIDIGFKPPTGVGLSIDAPPVKGGGFLNYDEATSTYTGGLELNFSKISFSAIGILTTKLPGGDSGYSLLIIISAEFTPLQIGMGFTINGVGGLLGLNRTSNADVLRSGIRYNTLDHILFPKDIIKNSNAIISTVGQAFPVLKDQFVVGPMAKINWGTPALLTIELGIIIELPDPLRLLILGILKAQLPNEKNAILKIQVNFLGVIDFKEKYLSFDATLYDSKILSFGLYGDMALRLNWGNRPNFLLSVGGFHPSYTPPPLNLPSMQRLTIVLADSKNLKIAVETYFAITSNSAQFGASVYAMARAWKVQAIGALWFDVLFQFSPFYFNANMGVKFAIKMGRRTLLSLYIELSLEGPEPWRAKGSGSFKVLFVRVRIRFNATFGSQRVAVIQAVAIDSKIKEALKSPDNWEFILPERNSQMVTWRKESPTEDLSVDPAGTIKISQRLLPLNTLMSKFGSSAISDFNRYTIKTVSIDSSNLPIKKVQDYFARNEFAYMSDDDKLSRDGYELFDSGVLVGSEDNISANYVVHKACGYENIILDAGRRRHLLLKFMLTAQRLRIESTFGYIGSSKLSTSRSITISGGPNRVNLSTLKGEFVLANRNNLKRVAPSVSFANSIQAEQYLSEQRTLNPNSTADWIIANRYELV